MHILNFLFKIKRERNLPLSNWQIFLKNMSTVIEMYYVGKLGYLAYQPLMIR